jgi:restriction system protein
MAVAWREYQEEAAVFFRSLGLDSSTDVTVQGVRTKHDIDVLVKSQHAGFEIIWIVECKLWKTSVSKFHVLALREIVSDIGADRGILLSESGFQSGAIEAANLTNVRVTSLAEVSKSASSDFCSMRMRELYDRIDVCRERYWDIPKAKRIEFGLRPDLYETSYSGARTVEFSKSLLSCAFRGIYPILNEVLEVAVIPDLPEQYNSPEEVVKMVDYLADELENKLDAYAASQ